MSKDVDAIFKIYDKLSEEEIVEFNERLSGISSSIEKYMTDIRFANGLCCPHCGAIEISKNGKRPDGRQTYVCKHCGKYFNVSSNSIVSYSHKEFNIWSRFIECMMQGLSLRKTAEICGIHRNTAFSWRHKVLDTLQEMADAVVLDGIVEADETYFHVSYKGNHKNSKDFTMPRRARHHGGKVGKRGISNEQLCVPCAVNRTGLSIAMTSNTGHISIDELHKVFDGRIAPDAELCTDKMTSYKAFAADNKITLHQFKLKEPTKGIYNIQHINNYHSTLKIFMLPFRGVSSKYLNNYLHWHNFVNYAGETYTQKKAVLMLVALTGRHKILANSLRDRAPLPVLA